jgi:erythromycin esterase-like protein
MYLNFRWLAQRLPPRSKIILWGATFHFAKDSSTDAEYTMGGNLGSFIHRAYGRQAFALGFSALSGSFRYSRQEPDRAFPRAPNGSLESQAFADTTADAVYLDTARLKAMRNTPGRLDGYVYITHPWDRAVDGVVVFRRQRPPQRTDGS